MSRVAAVLLALVVLICAESAAAQETNPRAWSGEVGAGWIVLGPGERPTGGIMPTIGGAYTVPLGESARAHAALSAGVFGLGGDVAWLGVLAGPEVGASMSPVKGVSVGASVGVDGGRIPVCNPWGLCLPYWAITPRASVAASYDVAEAFAVAASLQARYVATLGWSGVSWEPRVAGRVSF